MKLELWFSGLVCGYALGLSVSSFLKGEILLGIIAIVLAILSKIVYDNTYKTHIQKIQNNFDSNAYKNITKK